MVSTTKTSVKFKTIVTPYKLRLLVEWLVLFFGAPFVLSQDLISLPGRMGKLILLFTAMLICLVYLLWDKKFDNRRLLGFGKVKLIWKGLVLRVILCAVLLLVLCRIFYPEMLFAFLKYNPKIWAVVFVLYPLLSALPQELIYRSFMFQRYTAIFGNNWGLITASSVAFAFLHIIYLNWIAIVFTLVAGFIFSINYKKTGCLIPVTIEHGIYGNLLFTIGFGMFFFRAM